MESRRVKCYTESDDKLHTVMNLELPLPDSPPTLVRKAPGILRVVIYTRISKVGKSNSTNTSIQTQECLEELRYLARDRGVRVIIVAVFQEDDRSASKYSKKPRPMWNQTVSLVGGN